jgi:RNA polymerase sigma-70 factor (ECF subfamily)
MERDAQSAHLWQMTTGLAGGHDEAWSRFHLDYGPGIFRQLLAASWGDYELATEALQHTYLRVARHARPCDSAEMFASWLRLLARSALNDCRRRRASFWSRLVPEANALEAPAPEKANEDRLLAALDDALAQLTESERNLLMAKYLSDRSVAEIAGSLAVSTKAVESRLTRARAELRRHLLAALPRHEG